jgi:recombination protein RecA
MRCGVDAVSHVESPKQFGFSLPEKYFVPPPIKKGLHGGGFGSHPRNEAKNLSDAVRQLLRPETPVPNQVDSQHRKSTVRTDFEQALPFSATGPRGSAISSSKPWSRIGQALRVADLLLQGGGFSAIVLDMGSIAPEYVLRVPLSTWFRYRAAAERPQASVLLLTQHPCAKSSAELSLRIEQDNLLHESGTVFAGIQHRLEVARRRFTQATIEVVPPRKPPQNESNASWCCRTTWAGPR